MLLKLIHEGIPRSDRFTSENRRLAGLTPISFLFIILINAHSLLPEGYFLRMVRESRVDD
jgi:hypothetical protein